MICVNRCSHQVKSGFATRHRALIVCLVGMLLLGHVLAASADTATESVTFDSPEKTALYHQLLNEYRCLKCQNQTIGDSAAGLAEDLRREVFNMVNEGKQEPEITAFLVARYGEFVRYRPAFNASTFLLWLGPFLLLLIGGIAVLRQSRQRAAPVAVDSTHLQDARSLLRHESDE